LTIAENQARRIRETILVLDEHTSTGVPMKRTAVWNEVVARVPLLDEEAVRNNSAREKGMQHWIWASTDLARADWMRKDPSSSGDWYITSEGSQALMDFPDAVEFARVAKARYSAWSKEHKARQESLLASSIVAQSANQERIRTAASLFVERGLQSGQSVFVADRAAWSAQSVAELVEHFINRPDVDGDSFVEKLAGQLEAVSEDAKLLMAELVTWQLLPVSPEAIGEKKKLLRIRAVLDAMEHPVQIPEAISSVFDAGSFNPGSRMSSGLFPAVSIIIRVVENWFALPEDDRQVLFDNPLAWRDFINGAEGESFPTQRNALLYLTRPDFFGPVVSAEHKQRIRDTFIGEISDPTGDIDADLFAITVALQTKNKAPVNFYAEQYRERWDPASTTPAIEPIPVGLPVATRVSFPAADATLADALVMDQTWLQKTLNLLERRNQVILYGPPGTGKTFLARALARHIGDGSVDTTTLVQFHPSYSYEDFFEGFRPVSTEGALTYELRPGPMKRIAEQARVNPDLNYILIIDEINRGNLAKIFGELYFLLEYRDESVSLLYGDSDRFTLPSNVFIIGTMNTSDRSIALMDAAMRRRFAFVELHPSQEPTSSVLRKWLAKNGLSAEPAALLSALNARITDSSFKVGPSYLMDKQRDLSEDRLTEIWDHEILPLLEDLHYGDGVDVAQRYGLSALRRSLRSASETVDSGDPLEPGSATGE